MAEPIAVIGTAGALANILGVLAQAISVLADLRSQWTNADLAVVTLESQLAALTTALRKIQDWAETTPDAAPHTPLAMDLDRCMICCRILVSRIDDEVRVLGTTDDNVLDRLGKLRLLIKTSDFRNMQRMIDQQTAALTLLLTACTATTIEQKSILERTTTRQAFTKLQGDTASLYAHRDVDSIVTDPRASTIASSKRSLLFGFDSELLMGRIYQRWMRGSVKKKLWEQQDDTPFENHQRLKQLEEQLEKTREERQNDIRILVLGDESRARAMKMISDYLKEGVRYRNHDKIADEVAVIAEVCRSTKQLILAIQALEVPPADDDPVWEHVNIIKVCELQEFEAILYTMNQLDPTFLAALKSIQDTGFYKDIIEERGRIKLSETAKYFLSAIDAISPKYYPSFEDLLRAGPGENQLTMGGYRLPVPGRDFETRICLTDPGNDFTQSAHWLKILPQLNLHIFVFVFDLDKCDKVTNGETELDRSVALLSQAMKAACSVAKYTHVILILQNETPFHKRLAERRIIDVFRPYINYTSPYIIRRFEQCGGSVTPISTPYQYSHEDSALLPREFSATLEKTLVAYNVGKTLIDGDHL